MPSAISHQPSPIPYVIDTTGIAMFKNRRNFDRGQGENDIGQYNKEDYVFGASGSSPLYRRAMLEDIKVMDEYFDSFFLSTGMK